MSKLKVTVNKETYELIMERIFNAPRQLVWKAYTTPELIAQWWGPHAFDTTVEAMDVRPGGVWHYVMHANDLLKGTELEGIISAGKGIYKEVKEPELLVYVDYFVDKDGEIMQEMPAPLITTTFEDLGEMTRMISTAKYNSLEELEKVVSMGVEQGTAETFEKLDTLLSSL